MDRKFERRWKEEIYKAKGEREAALPAFIFKNKTNS